MEKVTSFPVACSSEVHRQILCPCEQRDRQCSKGMASYHECHRKEADFRHRTTTMSSGSFPGKEALCN